MSSIIPFFPLVKTGNTLWVDSINGDDAGALRGRPNRSFKTIQAALTESLDGDLVRVFPGTYDATMIQITVPVGVTLQGIDARRVLVTYAGDATGGVDVISLGERSLLDSVDIQMNPVAGIATGIHMTHIQAVAFRCSTNPNSTGNYHGCHISATGTGATGKAKLKLVALLGGGTGAALRVTGGGVFLIGQSNFDGSIGALIESGDVTFETTKLGGTTVGLRVLSGAIARMSHNAAASSFDIQVLGQLFLDAESFPRNKTSTVDPGTGDDSVDGFAIGSRWTNTARKALYICVDAAVGAAVWSYIGQTPSSEEEVSTNEVSTSSVSYTLISNMTITPGKGKYLVSFSGNAKTDTSGRPAFFKIFSGGGDQGTERQVPHTEYSPVYVVSEVTTANNTQEIEGRFKRDAGAPGPSAFIKDRSLVVLRIG